MERTLSGESGRQNFLLCCFVIEKVLGWLERKDTEAEKTAGCGMCLAAVTYFLARLLQSVF